MSTFYAPSARVIWSLAGSALGTVISEAGNSGTWRVPNATPPASNPQSPVNLQDVTDMSLLISVGSVTGSPSVTFSLNVFDPQGNAYPTEIATSAITAAGKTLISGGLHAPAAGSYLVLPQWGQVAWTAPGSDASLNDVQITVYGR